MRKENTVNQDLDENLICRSLDACFRKRGMTLFVYCLLSGVAHAECVPTPDCASIGYTETSCETQAVKCPFDASKLFCLPCDSSYKYTCSGDNITGGIGSSCGGKYVSCSCASNYEWNGSICKQNCTVGMIYYSDKSCSSTYDSSKTPIGVVVKDNELVIGEKSSYMMSWGTYGTDLSLTDYNSATEGQSDFNGKTNTATIIAEDSGAEAAKYCNDYTTSGTSAGDWYLPATGELYHYVCGHIDIIQSTMTSLGWIFEGGNIWASTEYSDTYAWYGETISSNCSVGSIYKSYGSSYKMYVSCFLEIN